MIKFGIRAIRETFISLMFVISDVIKNFSFLNIKSIFLKQRDQIKNNSPIIFSKLKNLFVANLDLGLYHFYKGNFSDAVLRFNFIKLMKKNHPSSWYYLGRCAFLEKNIKKSLLLFNQSLSFQNINNDSSFYIKIIKNDFTDNVPIDVIKEEFEYKAHYYVQHYLIENNYIAHKIVFDELIAVFGREIAGIEVLDIGCGTGICGHFLKICSTCKRIDGIDISENMLKIAENCKIDGKAVYTNLVQADYLNYLQNENNKYDAVISVLVFNYLSKLDSALSLCVNHINKSGIIVVIMLLNNTDESVTFNVEDNIFLFSKEYLLNYLKKISDELNLDFTLIDCIPYDGKSGVVITFNNKKQQ